MNHLIEVEPAARHGASCALSVVVPVFNEQEALPAFHRRLGVALAAVKGECEWEVVYVDDGSTDATRGVLRKLQAGDPAVGVARFSRNFGKEAAMTAGLRLARGAAVVVIDADLQHPPEAIGSMVQAWREGADVVNMRRRSRQNETWFKRVSARMFYRMINRVSEVPIPADVGDFRLLSRRAVEALNRLDERTRFMKGLFAWIGYREVTLDYDVQERVAGTTKWHYGKLWAFALEGITSFSVAPLKLASYAGFASALGAFLYALSFLIKTLLVGEPVRGFPTLIVTILLLGGLQLMATGILGEYLGRLFIETKRRPLYLLDDYRPASVPVLDSSDGGRA